MFKQKVKPKTGISKHSGEKIHYSVGALIKKGNKYLLIDRVHIPYGFAGLAGHIDEGESETEALYREVEEESGLKIKKCTLLFKEEIANNTCSKKINTHYWYLFDCEIKGNISQNYAETKSIGWYTKTELKNLTLEPVWEYWFKKLMII